MLVGLGCWLSRKFVVVLECGNWHVPCFFCCVLEEAVDDADGAVLKRDESERHLYSHGWLMCAFLQKPGKLAALLG